MEPATRLTGAKPPAGIALILCLLSGCVTTGGFTLPEVKPHGPVCQIVATWQPEVVFAPDTVHGGIPVPGLTGRLYLFGPEIRTPQTGSGDVVVDLYDETPLAEGKPAVMLEEWRLDKDTLQKLERKDAIGWGYSLFLPWGTYKTDITQVRLRLRYQVPGGSPLYTESAPIPLRSQQTQPPTISRTGGISNVPARTAANAGFASERR